MNSFVASVVIVTLCGNAIHPKEQGYLGSEVLVPQESHEPSTAVMFLQISFPPLEVEPR